MMTRQALLSGARVLLRAAIMVLVAGTACGDDPLAPACSGPIEVQVSGSLPPVISWTPDCSVERLSATASVSTAFVVYWAIAARDRRIESGVRFGHVPRGVTEESEPATLVSGMHLGISLESPRGTPVGLASWRVP